MPRLLQQETSVLQQPTISFFPEKVAVGTFHLSKKIPHNRALWRRAGTLKVRTRSKST